MSDNHSIPSPVPCKPAKPSPDFPLFPHATGRWAKKIKGRMHYFGRWEDPDGALREYQDFLAGKPREPRDHPATAKPAKPSPDFPLTPHSSGQWSKKFRGRTVYFGRWSDPQGALAKYNAQKDDLRAGRTPRPDAQALTVKDLANEFLTAKQAQVDAGELSPRTFADYKATTDLLIERFGKQRLVSDLRPDDFAALRKAMTARKWGSHRLVKGIQYTRSIFKYAFEADLIPVPMRFGPGFKRPSKRTMRVERARQGAKLFTREEIHQLLGVAGTSLKAMILLGVNCGYGNSDCGLVPLAAVDLQRGWIDYARPKTGIARRCPLWPETVQALREVLAKRKEPKSEDDAGRFFITKYGDAWAKSTSDNPVTKEMRKLLKSVGLNGHRNFYCLRHTFRTVADEARDQPAADHIMGHESPHMSSVYRERISDERLKDVSDYVRGWLFPPAPDQPTGKRAVEEEE